MTDDPLDGRISARRGMAIGAIGVALLVVGTFGWAAWASISGAVISSGHVAVAERNQPVEHVYGGEVLHLHVRNGDRVAAGEPLLRFAGSSFSAELAIVESDLAQLVARRSRLDAERLGAPSLTWDPELAQWSADSPSIAQMLDNEAEVFDALRAVHADQAALHAERVRQTGLELAALEEEARSGGGNAAEIARARALLAQLEREALTAGAARISEAEAELRDVHRQEQELRTRRASLRNRIAHLDVRAPTAGTVFALDVAGPGDVVRPGAPMMHLVPDDSALVVIARVAPSDIDQVFAGQRAVILFPSFPYRSAPEREGVVRSVSADAIADARSGAAYFEAELEIVAAAADRADGEGADGNAPGSADLSLVPGMPAEVQIATGSRSVLSYLVKPVTDFFGRSLREE